MMLALLSVIYREKLVTASEIVDGRREVREGGTNSSLFDRLKLSEGKLSGASLQSIYNAIQYNCIVKCQYHCLGMFHGAMYTHPTFTPIIKQRIKLQDRFIFFSLKKTINM